MRSTPDGSDRRTWSGNRGIPGSGRGRRLRRPAAAVRPSRGLLTSQEQALSEILGEFARTMVTDFPIQAILDRLVERMVQIVPVTAAGVSLINPAGTAHYGSASNQFALQYEKLQSELNEGPALLAWRTGQLVTVEDFRTEERFPVFAPRALAAGLRSSFTFPLRHREYQLGALDLYRRAPGPLSVEAMRTATTLADVTAAYLVNAQARDDLLTLSTQTRHAALHDALTGLPNRILLTDRLGHAFARSRRTGKAAALLYVDLDQFKAVNDTYGHSVGDALLVGVAGRLTDMLRPHDTLARMAGDEFVVLCEDLDTVAEAGLIGTRLRTGLARPFTVAGHTLTIGASVGIAFADRHTEYDPDQLLHEADMAMYAAKRHGRDNLVLRPSHAAVRLVDLQRDLGVARQRGEFHLLYQPIVATDDGRVTGVEALLRWSHPVHGPVGPDVFIPLAEQCGLINDIGRWVLQQACEQVRSWHLRGLELTVSVNVSVHQLMSPAFADTVATVVHSTGISPAQLTLEITESVFVRDRERALVILTDLKELGVMLALDDFGTGYSSLSYLRHFPIDTVKIDRTFIADLGLDSTTDIIVGAVVKLAHDLHLSVVAEGIETTHQHRGVAGLGCDHCQGYFFATPMAAADIEAMLFGSPGGQVLLPANADRRPDGRADGA